jgi:RNA polymerase sigma factor (sigma-70 family)
MNEFDGRASFSTWLMRVAINSALMLVRKRKGSRLVPLSAESAEGVEADLEVVDQAPSPETGCLRRELDEAVRCAVRSLRPSVRQAIELQQFEEWPVREVGRAMGISVAATKSRLSHAKAALRKSSALRTFRRRPNRPRVLVSRLSDAGTHQLHASL